MVILFSLEQQGEKEALLPSVVKLEGPDRGRHHLKQKNQGTDRPEPGGQDRRLKSQEHQLGDREHQLGDREHHQRN